MVKQKKPSKSKTTTTMTEEKLPLPEKPRNSRIIVGGVVFECLGDMARKARIHLDKGTHRPDIILELEVYLPGYLDPGHKLVILETRADCIQGVIE